MLRTPILGTILAALLPACSASKDASAFDDGRGDLSSGAEARLPYPSGPYGTVEGAVVENFHFLGWSNPKEVAFDTAHLAPLSLAEFYDPKGAKDIRFLVVTTAAQWCSACRVEWANIRDVGVASYEKRGVRFLGTLFEDNNGAPATPRNLRDWTKQYAADFPSVLDPEFHLGVFFDVEATPMSMVIDTKTMTILSMETGWVSSGDQSLWAYLDTLTGS